MANYTTNVGSSGGGFQTISPTRTSGGSRNRDQVVGSALENMITSFAKGAMRGSARKAGKELSGINLTNEQVSNNMALFESSVEKGTEDYMQNNPNGIPDDDALADIRQAAMNDLGLTDRTVRRLIAEDKIRSLEGQAYIRGALNEKLSNPFLAMYEQDFMNQLRSFTGGTGANDVAAYGLSPTEKEEEFHAKAAAKARKETFDAIYQRASDTGEPVAKVEAAWRELRSNQIKTEAVQERMLANETVSDEQNSADATRYSDQVLEQTILAITQPGNLVDGKLTPEGAIKVEKQMSAKYASALRFISTSGMSETRQKQFRDRLSETYKAAQAYMKPATWNKLVADSKEMGLNFLELETMKKYPLVIAFGEAGLPNVAKLVYDDSDRMESVWGKDSMAISQEKRDEFAAILNISINKPEIPVPQNVLQPVVSAASTSGNVEAVEEMKKKWPGQTEQIDAAIKVNMNPVAIANMPDYKQKLLKNEEATLKHVEDSEKNAVRKFKAAMLTQGIEDPSTIKFRVKENVGKYSATYEVVAYSEDGKQFDIPQGVMKLFTGNKKLRDLTGVFGPGGMGGDQTYKEKVAEYYNKIILGEGIESLTAEADYSGNMPKVAPVKKPEPPKQETSAEKPTLDNIWSSKDLSFEDKSKEFVERVNNGPKEEKEALISELSQAANRTGNPMYFDMLRELLNG